MRVRLLLEIVENPQRLQIVGGRNVLRQASHLEVIDHLVSGGVDDVHGIAFGVGNVDARRKIAHHGTQHAGAVE